MISVQFAIEEDYRAAKATIEANVPEAKVSYRQGKGAPKAPDLNRPYTFMDDELLVIEADDHVVEILEIELQ